MRMTLTATAVLAVGWLTPLLAQEAKTPRVTVDNFARAETDTYFARFVKGGAFGKFDHERELTPIDRQAVIRMNRDTLYSQGVFDLDASPVTITMPNAGKRYMAMQVINEDHFTTEVVYASGPHTLTRDKVGTRYVLALVRTFVNPNDAADVKAVHALQDALKAEQKETGKFEIPNWDPESLKQIRDALNSLLAANGGLDSTRMFGRKGEVDPVQHLLGTAGGWGGNPRTDAFYAGVLPKQNDGKSAYRLTLKDVPVDGFWSVSVYNQDGFFEKNARDAYTLNDVTAKPAADGSVTIHFGGNEHVPNYLPITPGWNYVLRLYRPRKAILDGTWEIPEAVPGQ